MNKLRILVAEDHSVVREGLKLLIDNETDMEVVGEAGDGIQAVRETLNLRPDILVMDISMPGLSGDQVTLELKKVKPDIKVLALSVHEDKGYLRRLLQAGASGYVLKRAAAQELINAIRVVSQGGVYLDPNLAGRIVSSFLHSSQPDSGRQMSALSARETEVIRLIAQGYSNKEIALELNISVKTVETYKARAMEKTGLHSRADIVRYALQHGWLQSK